MSFLLTCPNCGPRSVYEFRFGGEIRAAEVTGLAEDVPGGEGAEEWGRYLYARRNEAGVQQEWWYHRAGCRKWFQAVRNTVSNTVERSFWAGGSVEPDAVEASQASQGSEAEP